MRYTLSQIVSTILIVFGGLILFSCTSKELPRKPNIILILVDDLGWADVGCYGNTYYETPNIDKLAAEGMKFTNGYAASAVCSPTRGALMTGRYPTRLGITDWIHHWYPIENGEQPIGYESSDDKKLQTPKNYLFLDHDEITIAEILKKVGYTTCHVGKWHLGQKDWWPETHGFDYNIGGYQQGQPDSYFDPYNNPSMPDRKKGEYLTDREADEATGFIKKALQQNKPFFLYMAHYTVHTPIQAKMELIEYYQNKKIPEDRDFHPKYAAMVHSLDDAVGTITSTLEKLGVTDNTVIIFTSDNGGLKLRGNKDGSSKWTDNTPLRAGKGFPYEGGIREPFIVKWPGQIKPGSSSYEMVSSIDILPTICEMIGQQNQKTKSIDGKSLIPALVDNERLDRKTLYWHYPHYWNGGGVAPYSVIRDGDWKLIRWYEDNIIELYDLKNDLSEDNDLSIINPNKVNELQDKLDMWLKETGAKLPKLNPNYNNERKIDHLAIGKKIILKNDASPKYSDGDKNILLNGIMAPSKISNGWLGFEGDDFVATIDLQSIKSIKNISVNFLQHQKDWIFLPTQLKVFISNNGKNFRSVASLNKENIKTPKKGNTILIAKKFENVKSRYIKVIAKNIGQCPKGHPGEGGKAWLFVDEILVN